jgi:hypothetical protein
MSDDAEPKGSETARPSNLAPRKRASGPRPADSAQSLGSRLCRIPYLARWHHLLLPLFLAAITISIRSAETTTDRMLLPVEVLGANGTTVSKTVALQAGQAESVRSLWLQINGLGYADQAGVQVNTSAWIPLNNSTVTNAEPGRSFGGIGGVSPRW